jgi:lipopolysaccharide export system permease protein
MDVFGRYVFRQIAASFVLIIVTLTMIVWLTLALRELNLLTSQGQGILLFLQMTALALPNTMALIAPNAALIACLFVFDRLNGDSELIIMSASGSPVWRLAVPLLAFTTLLAAVLLVMALYIQPLSQRTLRSMITQVRTDLISQVLQPGRFSSPEEGLTFHIRDRAPNNDLLGLLVHDERDKTQTVSYLAKRGRIVSTDDGAYLVMTDGQIHRRVNDEKGQSGEVGIGEFKEYIFNISQFQPQSTVREYRPSERYVSELISPDPDDEYAKNASGQLRSELHERFSSVLYPFVYVMVVLAFLGQARTIRENRWKALVAAFGVSIAVRFAGLASINLLTLQAWAVVLVYGIPLVAILVAALAAHVRMAPYARLRMNLALPAKLLFYNNNIWAALGARTQQQRGRVG